MAEPDPGPDFDNAVLGIGAAAIAVLTVATALPAALLGLRSRAQRPKLSRLASAAAASGLSPAAVQGVRFAVLGGGPRPVPIRSTLVAVTAAIMSVFATITFAASLVALIDTPSRYGQGWDRMVDAQFGPAPVTRIIERIGSSTEARIGFGNRRGRRSQRLHVPSSDSMVLRSCVRRRPGGAADTAGRIVLGGEKIDGVALGGDPVESTWEERVDAVEWPRLVPPHGPSSSPPPARNRRPLGGGSASLWTSKRSPDYESTGAIPLSHRVDRSCPALTRSSRTRRVAAADGHSLRRDNATDGSAISTEYASDPAQRGKAFAVAWRARPSSDVVRERRNELALLRPRVLVVSARVRIGTHP